MLLMENEEIKKCSCVTERNIYHKYYTVTFTLNNVNMRVANAPNPMYVNKPRITHADLEQNFNSFIKQTPEFAIRNVGTNPLFLIPALFIPNSRNTIRDRYHRIVSEKFYIVYSDWMDKLSLVLSLMSIIASLVITAHAYTVGAHKIYVFTNPDNIHDVFKSNELETLNGIWSTQAWDLTKLMLAGLPSLVQCWRTFKRTSVPSPGNENIRTTKLEALADQNRRNLHKNQLAMERIARFISYHSRRYSRNSRNSRKAST